MCVGCVSRTEGVGRELALAGAPGPCAEPLAGAHPPPRCPAPEVPPESPYIYIYILVLLIVSRSFLLIHLSIMYCHSGLHKFFLCNVVSSY